MLQVKFEQLRQNIEPTEAQKDSIISTHTHLRQSILQRLSYVKNTILTGSYKRKTMIRPLNDVDIFVLLNYEANNYHNPTPQTVLSRLKDDLKLSYPNTFIKQDKPCISLEFNHCKFELTPAIEVANYWSKYYQIPNSNDLRQWQQVDDPDILGEQLTRANSTKPILIPLIKMMKKCKEFNNIKSPKSFEMEILALNQLRYTSSYRDGVQQLLGIYGWLNSQDLWNVKAKSDLEFAQYCRTQLFGTDFPN